MSSPPNPPSFPGMLPPVASFTLLDDRDANPAQPSSRLYTELHQVLHCANAEQFTEMTTQLHAALQQGWYAVAVFSYELGHVLHGLCATTDQPSSILLYGRCQQLSREQVDQWLQEQIGVDEHAAIAGITKLTASVTEAQFTEAIKRIQDYIAAGDTYQVNYTYRYHFQTYGNLFALYQRLRLRQSVPFGALIALPDGSALLSLSPELFVQHRQGQLITRPMKGTAAASANKQLNAQRAVELANDAKNRAENLMIVDLLRNDLGRIAQSGSVHVPQLFEVEQFNSVLQMTSSVTAHVRDDVSLAELLCALYPCGSITGAPKYRTMHIIEELETEARGIYTGTIGWFDPVSSDAVIPDFCLSVPIRTLQLQAPDALGNRQGKMGVGAGIVFDSVAADEYQECQLKAGFLTGLPPQFSLFETMYAERQHGCRHLQRHLHRLSTSAHYFGITLNLPDIQQQLQTACTALIGDDPYRVKLSVDGSGKVQIQSAPLLPITAPVKLILASQHSHSDSFWLQHKTTQRDTYDQAWQEAERRGAFDMVFCNEQGELTEGGRSNLLVKLAGQWFTPPLAAGVLPGVMRSVIMDDPRWRVTERRMTLDDLHNAEALALCNALRGVLPAQLQM